MGLLARLRRLFRRAPPPAEPPEPPVVMHMQGSWATPLCGAFYGPYAPVTIEPDQNMCLACRRVWLRRRFRSTRHR